MGEKKGRRRFRLVGVAFVCTQMKKKKKNELAWWGREIFFLFLSIHILSSLHGCGRTRGEVFCLLGGRGKKKKKKKNKIPHAAEGARARVCSSVYVMKLTGDAVRGGHTPAGEEGGERLTNLVGVAHVADGGVAPEVNLAVGGRGGVGLHGEASLGDGALASDVRGEGVELLGAHGRALAERSAGRDGGGGTDGEHLCLKKVLLKSRRCTGCGKSDARVGALRVLCLGGPFFLAKKKKMVTRSRREFH